MRTPPDPEPATGVDWEHVVAHVSATALTVALVVLVFVWWLLRRR